MLQRGIGISKPQLSSGTLHFTLNHEYPRYDNSETPTQLEKLIAENDDAEMKRSYQMQLLHTHLRRSDITSIEKTFSKLARWLKMHADTRDADKLSRAYGTVEEIRPEFHIGSNRLLFNIVAVLSLGGRGEQALELLEEHKRFELYR